MSNIHVLERSSSGYRVALHIAVPAGNNAAGTAWSSVAIKSGRGGRTVLADGTGTDGGIAAAEKTTITNGTVLEVVDVVTPPDDANTAAKINAWLDGYFAAKSTEVLADIQAQLSQYGRVR